MDRPLVDDRQKALAFVQVSIPYRRLSKEFLPIVTKRRVNVELGLDAGVLDGTPLSDFREKAALFGKLGLNVTLHAPFLDLSPGALDPAILDATRERLRQFAGVARLFDPLCVVCHTGWDARHHGFAEKEWLATAEATLRKLTESLAETTRAYVALENVYERTPRILIELSRRIAHKRLGFCLDTGHVKAFSGTPLVEWLAALGPKIREVHIHDNGGQDDDHLAPGEGVIDFAPLFDFLRQRPGKVILTLEAHSEAGVMAGLDYIGRHLPGI